MGSCLVVLIWYTCMCTVRWKSQHLHVHDYRVQHPMHDADQSPNFVWANFRILSSFLISVEPCFLIFWYILIFNSFPAVFLHACLYKGRLSRMQATHQCIINKDKVVPGSVNRFSPNSRKKKPSVPVNSLFRYMYPCFNKPLNICNWKSRFL